MLSCSTSHKDPESIKAGVWQVIKGVKQSGLVGVGEKKNKFQTFIMPRVCVL